jgi:hypothetical protein
MATKQQITANRINAQKSTGPQSPGGKTNSSRNATKHGLFANDVLAAGEAPELYDALLEEFINRPGAPMNGYSHALKCSYTTVVICFRHGPEHQEP